MKLSAQKADSPDTGYPVQTYCNYTCIQNFYVYSLHIKVPLFAGLPDGNMDACGNPGHWSGLELSKYFTHEDNSCFITSTHCMSQTSCPFLLMSALRKFDKNSWMYSIYTLHFTCHNQ